MTITANDIRTGVLELRLSGLPLCVHSSLRSFGRVEGGAHTVIEALLLEGCTVLVPTFSWAYAVDPPPHLRPARNGTDYAATPASTRSGRIFTTDSTEIDRGAMGAVPATVAAMERRRRGHHPLNSFSAIGPLADRLIDGQAPDDVYMPLEALADAGGWVVLMGIGLTSMTLLHLAEKRAGRVLFRRWAKDKRDTVRMVETGGCSLGFDRFEQVIGPLSREVKVGASRWRAFPAAETVEKAVTAIQRDPTITRCGRDDCERCRDAVPGGPLLLR